MEIVCCIKEGCNIWIKWSVSILIHLNLLLICLVQDTQVHSLKSAIFAHGKSVPGTFEPVIQAVIVQSNAFA